MVSLVFVLHGGALRAQVAFEETAVQAGINHMHRSMFQMGGGIAVLDFDNDGWEDVYLTGGLDPDRLYRNLGNGQFEDVSSQSGITGITTGHESFGVAAGDLDNDGDRDIIVTGSIGNPVLLLRNQGDGTFALAANALPSNNVWTTSVSLGDINKDGYLDIYIAAYVFSSQMIRDEFNNVVGFAHDCSANLLFINNGNFTFTEAASGYGLADQGCALAVAFTDFDNDNDADVLLTNDFGEWVLPSGLFRNQYPQNWFDDISGQYQMDVEMYGMGIAIGDYDRDLDLDYYQTNIGRNLLSRNDGGVFEDVTTEAEVENDSLNGLNTTSWGCFFFDADNDSWTDLFVANGQLPVAPFIANVPNDPNKLYLNNADGTFSDVSDSAGLSSPQRSHGAVFADFDKDGRVDVMVSNNGNMAGVSRVEYFRNVTSNNNHWVSFTLEGSQSNRDAIGSRVTAWIDGLPLLAEVDGGSSHASHNSTRVHFGVGDATVLDSVSVLFPSGISYTFVDVVVDQNHHIEEDVAVSLAEPEQGNVVSILSTESGIVIQAAKSADAEIELLDMLGRTVWRSELSLQSGANAISEIPPFLPQAAYVIRVSLSEASFTQRIMLLR